MKEQQQRPGSVGRSFSVSWSALQLFLCLFCYLVSTGPVCRWSYRTARRIYAPLSPIANSDVLRPLVKSWLSLWHAAPWWSVASPASGQRAAFAVVRLVNGKAVTIINGVASDVDIAKLRQAADAGDPAGQLQLGTCLYDGKHGVTTNYAEAYKWITLAAAKGQKEANYLKREMELFLTPQNIEAGSAPAANFER